MVCGLNLDWLGGSIPSRPTLIKSPSEMNKVGRAVKGSAIMCYRFYYKAGGRIGTRTENP